ncbi:MAG TPA: hypothetical protein VEM41_03745 [Actinomycetota bacterium]|nr:hypothetical protein [Actinomycetota bacterium]
MEIPETRYATTADGVSSAYQVLGDGPLDVVLANSAFVSNVEMVWELFPYVARSGLRVEDSGEHELRGVPDHWSHRVVG